MTIRLNWEIKYNLFMRKENGENIKDLLIEVNKYQNADFESFEAFAKALEYWGEKYKSRHVSGYSDSWLYQLDLINRNNTGTFKLESD